MTINTKDSINLLKKLIKTPSYSREEGNSAIIIAEFLNNAGIKFKRKNNNIWAIGKNYNSNLPTVLVCSHHDTVKPSASWTIDPHTPTEKDGKLYGLGSNDAGASLVSLLSVYIYYDNIVNKDFNIIFTATAEEEITGINGMSSIIEELGKIDLAIIGEPTKMQMAIAEKGLMVIDGKAIGKPGHAAREEGINSIYIAHSDIEWIKNYKFPKRSDLLGEVKMSVTQISAGQQHNMVPDICNYVIDVRSNELYSNKELFETININTKAEVQARSFRLNSSSINLNHPIVQKGIELGLSYYGSPTTSDQSVIPWTSIKIGPGDSARSHTADEFIYIEEIEEGIKIYIDLLHNLKL